MRKLFISDNLLKVLDGAIFKKDTAEDYKFYIEEWISIDNVPIFVDRDDIDNIYLGLEKEDSVFTNVEDL